LYTIAGLTLIAAMMCGLITKSKPVAVHEM
jgi:hypothetical protein